MLEISKDNYEKEVKQSKTPIIIDFWAEWCGPCRQLAPIFEAVSTEYKGKLKFAKLDSQKYPNIAGENGVTGIPCMIVFNKGEEVDRIIGFMDMDSLKEEIDAILQKIGN